MCGWQTTLGLHSLLKITNPLRILVNYFDDEGGTALITGDLYIAGFVRENVGPGVASWRHFCDSYEECDYVCLLDPAHYDRWKTGDKTFPMAHTRYFLSKTSLEQTFGKMVKVRMRRI